MHRTLYLGGRWQTARKLIDAGVIGKPTGVAAWACTHGVERHNPNPDFRYSALDAPAAPDRARSLADR